jgi:hypothetical protein
MNDAGYALLGVGVLVGGGTIARLGLDELLDPERKQKYAAEKASRIPLTKADKAVQVTLLAFGIGSLGMKLYDWYKTGKQPNLMEIP